MKLGEKIRMLRTLKGYTQEAMADSLKLSVTGYGKIERDETDVTVSRIGQIADVLGVKAKDILRLENNIAFYNYSGSRPHNFGHLTNYHNHDETFVSLKMLYESRVRRLEDEILEMRKMLFNLIKKNKTQ